MMKGFFELICKHRSVRKYQNRPIEAEKLERILVAATRASSSGNMQAYSIIVTQNQQMKEKLYPLHFHQSMVLEAPVFLTFCSDFFRMREWLQLSSAPLNFDNFMSFMIGAIDAILAAQNAALAAEAEGLGVCFLGTTLANCEGIAEVLQCPANVLPVVGFSVGYSAEDPEIGVRSRLPLQGIVHSEKYQRLKAEELKNLYTFKEKEAWERLNQDKEMARKIEDQGVKNLGQVYTQIKYTQSSHVKYSLDVLHSIRKRNFWNHLVD